jgi:hypothetical protein
MGEDPICFLKAPYCLPPTQPLPLEGGGAGWVILPALLRRITFYIVFQLRYLKRFSKALNGSASY